MVEARRTELGGRLPRRPLCATGGRSPGNRSRGVRPSRGGDAVADVDVGRDRRRRPLQRRMSHARGRVSVLRRAGAAVVFGRQVGVRQPRADAARAALSRRARAEGRGLRSGVRGAGRLERRHVREPARHVEWSLDLGRSVCGRKFSGHVEAVLRRTTARRQDRLCLWSFSPARGGGPELRLSHQRHLRARDCAGGFRATDKWGRRRICSTTSSGPTSGAPPGSVPWLDFSRRTRDDVRQPFVGFGLTLLPDDVAKLGQWLNPLSASARDLLDTRMLRSALQLDATDRGLATTADGTLLYNDGFWAMRIDDLPGCDVPVFVPFMSGFGGVTIALLPNGVTYYYFSDGNEFRFRRAVYAAAQPSSLLPDCDGLTCSRCQGSCFMNTSTPDAGTTAARTIFGLRKAAPDGEIARVLLAFLATAGIFYVNIMPALVDGLVQGAGFSNRQAGMVGSSNVYGAAIGALIAVFIVKRIQWRTWAYGLLAALIALDLLSMLVHRFEPLMAMRFLHGTMGGMLVGIGFAVMSRTAQADRTFGYLLVVQFGLGGLGLAVLPPLVPTYGTSVLFIALILFSLVTLAMVPFLTDYPASAVRRPKVGEGQGVRRGPLLLSLLATFFFQAGNMAVFAYVIGLGKADGLGMDFISPVLAAASWIGIAGSGLVILLSTRFGRAWPLAGSILLTALATWALHGSEIAWVYALANGLIGVTWSFGIPYLLGMCAQFDQTGQSAALGGFASKMGMASGPLAAAWVVGADDFGRVINVGAVALVLSLVAAMIPAVLLDRAPID